MSAERENVKKKSRATREESSMVQLQHDSCPNAIEVDKEVEEEEEAKPVRPETQS